MKLKKDIPLVKLEEYGFEILLTNMASLICEDKLGSIENHLDVTILIGWNCEREILIYSSNDKTWEEEQKDDNLYYDNLNYLPDVLIDMIADGLIEK